MQLHAALITTPTRMPQLFVEFAAALKELT